MALVSQVLTTIPTDTSWRWTIEMAHLPLCEWRTAPLFPVPPCLLAGLFLSVGDVSFSLSFVICHTSASLFTSRRAETCVHHLRLLLGQEVRSFDVFMWINISSSSCKSGFLMLSFVALSFTWHRSSPGRTQRTSKRSVRMCTISLILVFFFYFFCVVTFFFSQKKPKNVVVWKYCIKSNIGGTVTPSCSYSWM